MFSKLFAAAALAVVSAADVPLFSSNDDYDEINLNIRMLSNGTSAATPTTVAASVVLSADFPTGTTVPILAASDAFKTGAATALKATPQLSTATTVTVTAVTDASARRARALAASLIIAIAYDAVFPTSAAADTAVAAIATTVAAT
jgi:hypothetical protein